MMARIKTAIPIIIALLVLTSSPASALLKTGATLPELTGTTLKGEEFSLERLKGEPFILKIGTTWCGTCNAQAKTINDLRGYLKDKKVHYLDVFVQESAETVQQYFASKDYQHPDVAILDDGSIAKQLNIYLIPRVLLIDKNHQVYRDGANLSGSKLKQELERMLAED